MNSNSDLVAGPAAAVRGSTLPPASYDDFRAIDKNYYKSIYRPAKATQIYTFTLLFFKGNKIAILEVKGAGNQEEARAVACSILPKHEYAVIDGDQTGGHAEVFYTWCCSASQEALPHPTHSSKTQCSQKTGGMQGGNT